MIYVSSGDEDSDTEDKIAFKKADDIILGNLDVIEEEVRVSKKTEPKAQTQFIQPPKSKQNLPKTKPNEVFVDRLFI